MSYQVPKDGRRINIKSNSNSTIDNGTAILADGTGVSLSQASTTITINQSGTAEFLDCYTANDQIANLSANDHVKFNSVTSSAGSNISLDTSTGYTTTAGAASIGRFTLASGKTYLLYANITCALYNGTNVGNLKYAWYNANSSGGGQIGATCYNEVQGKSTTQNYLQAGAMAMITTSTSTLVEVRLLSVTSLAQFGAIGFGIPGALASIQLLSP